MTEKELEARLDKLEDSQAETKETKNEKYWGYVQKVVYGAAILGILVSLTRLFTRQVRAQ